MTEHWMSVLETPVEQGFHFIWAISAGQVAAIAVTLIGFVFGAGKFASIVYSLQKSQDSLEARMDRGDKHFTERLDLITETMSDMEKDTRSDVRELRNALQDLNKTLLALRIIAVDLGNNRLGDIGNNRPEELEE